MNEAATQPEGIHRRRSGWGWRYCLLGVALLAGMLAMGCARGTYPLDIFYEMHYQPTHRSYEPPRLDVPSSAVPMFPADQPTSFRGDAEHLYDVNCSMCHGPGGKGDGAVLQRMQSVYGYEPVLNPDLTSPQVQALGVDGVRGFMQGGVQVMPSFANLLTDEEMRLVAEYVQSLE